MEENEEFKSNVRGTLALTGDFTICEILEAIIMKDERKLDLMKKRCEQLKICYDNFVTELESGDKRRRMKAISSFKRPE